LGVVRENGIRVPYPQRVLRVREWPEDEQGLPATPFKNPPG
jgi:small-conductance mechanosensitive channel